MARLGEGRALTLPLSGRGGQVAAEVLAITAWALLVAGYATGLEGLLSHDVILEHSEIPLPMAALVFVAAWQIMIAAMMLPTALPAIHVFSRSGRRPRARADLVVFLGAYFALWTAFGIAALASDAGVHALTDSWGWLGDRPSLVAAGVLVVAGTYQFLPVKRRCLAGCRYPAALLTCRGPGQGGWQPGIRHALACLGSNWAVMLVMFAFGSRSLWWVVILTLVMVAEKTLPCWRWTVATVGAGLGSAGILIVLA